MVRNIYGDYPQYYRGTHIEFVIAVYYRYLENPKCTIVEKSSTPFRWLGQAIWDGISIRGGTPS